MGCAYFCCCASTVCKLAGSFYHLGFGNACCASDLSDATVLIGNLTLAGLATTGFGGLAFRTRHTFCLSSLFNTVAFHISILIGKNILAI